MPILKNPRHERFAQLLANGEPAAPAYEKAGFAYNEGNAVRLKGNEKVHERVRELQAKAAEKHGITRDKITEMLIEDRKLAFKVGQAGAARAASESLGRLHGLYIEKREDNVTVRDISDEPMTAEDWEREYAGTPGMGAAARSTESVN